MKRIFGVKSGSAIAAIAGLAAIGIACAASVRAQPKAEPLQIVANKATILRLTKPAQQVIIGDPRIFDATAETRTMLVLFGRTPGETNLIVLDSQNREILSIPVLVTSENDRHISIVSAGKSGHAEVVYNCDDRCVRVTLLGAAPAPSGGGAQGAAAAEPAPPAAAPPPGAASAPPIQSSPDDGPPKSGSYKR